MWAQQCVPVGLAGEQGKCSRDKVSDSKTVLLTLLRCSQGNYLLPMTKRNTFVGVVVKLSLPSLPANEGFLLLMLA